MNSAAISRAGCSPASIESVKINAKSANASQIRKQNFFRFGFTVSPAEIHFAEQSVIQEEDRRRAERPADESAQPADERFVGAHVGSEFGGHPLPEQLAEQEGETVRDRADGKDINDGDLGIFGHMVTPGKHEQKHRRIHERK